MTACEYSGRPPSTNSHQPSLRPEQHTARSELLPGTNQEQPGSRLRLVPGENELGTIIYQRGSPRGRPRLKSGLVLNQTDFTATRVPGGPEAGQALAFRRPSVTPDIRDIRDIRNQDQGRGYQVPSLISLIQNTAEIPLHLPQSPWHPSRRPGPAGAPLQAL